MHPFFLHGMVSPGKVGHQTLSQARGRMTPVPYIVYSRDWGNDSVTKVLALGDDGNSDSQKATKNAEWAAWEMAHLGF